MAYSSKFRGTLINIDPYIIYTASYKGAASPSALDELTERLKDKRVYFLQLVAWSHERLAHAQQLVEWSRKYTANPLHRIIFLANSVVEAATLRQAGGESFFIHQNSLIDPGLFFVIDNCERKHSAVYNAQFLSFKRYELAREVDDFAACSYHMDRAYYERAVKSLPNIQICNELTGDNLSWIGYNRLNRIYNESYCGLCLSAEEGGMHASAEYLLAGLPVVSTKSLGGRDYFFDSENSIIVEDDPRAVRDAVRALKASFGLERAHAIRHGIMEKQKFEIGKLKSLIVALLAEHGAIIDIDAAWHRFYRDKLLGHEDVTEFLDRGIRVLRG